MRILFILVPFILTSCVNCITSDKYLRGTWYQSGGHYQGVHPSMSPDGKKIVFGSTRYGLGEICMVNSDGSNWIRLTNTREYEGDPSFSSDGNKIVFISERDGNGEIYIMNFDGSNQKRITFSKFYNSYPSFSPDGTKIVFVRNVPEGQDSYYKIPQLFIINSDGSSERRLTYNDFSADPSFSPDGSKIIYKANLPGNNTSIVLKMMNLSDLKSTEITNKGNCHEPFFSPDQTEIIFKADWTDLKGKNEIFRININDSSVKRLTFTKKISIGKPSYINNGSQILFFVGTNKNGGDICIMNADGSGYKTITSNY